MKTLAELRVNLRTGQTTSRALTEEALGRITDRAGKGGRAFIRVFAEEALVEADVSDHLRAHGIVPSPLAGIPVSVKDLCDIAGVPTLAGSVVREDEPEAERDATVVARLRAAGAVIVGTTNMTEFAMGTPGTNPHYGTPRNPWDRATGRIPGGSSSGCAVSITDGMAAAGVGTDTAGSVRVPAGFCGLAGFKPTARRVPRDGVFPLSDTLDSVGPLARTVACCIVMDAIFAGEPPPRLEPFPLAGLRLAALTTLVLDDMEAEVAGAYEGALSALSAAGARIVELGIPALEALPELNRAGGFSTAEAFSVHWQTLQAAGEEYDPIVAERIRMGEEASAADYLELLAARARMIAEAHAATRRFDAVLMPTSPILPPPIAQLEDAAEWGRVNRRLVLRSLIANFLDRCALNVPLRPPGAPPAGLTLMGETMDDRRILEIGLAVEAALTAG